MLINVYPGFLFYLVNLLLILDVTDTASAFSIELNFLMFFKWKFSQHYWAALLSGDGTTVTMANKLSIIWSIRAYETCNQSLLLIKYETYISCFESTSGRSPKLGVGDMKNVDVH